MTEDEMQIRVHGRKDLPTLVYLPGIHGDWTLIGGFRKAIEGKVRFVEFTYPRTVTWSLQDYADAAERSLLEHGINRAWVLAESFGSQIVWPMAQGEGFKPEGVILAGGFGQHPARWGVVCAEYFCRFVPLWMVRQFLKFYRFIGKWRFRGDPEILGNLDAFVERRTEEDRQAAVHRFRLIRDNNPKGLARDVHVPVYAFTGLIDAIVPWIWARRWLQRNCPALRDYQIINTADHTVLCTGTKEAARLVRQWMKVPP